MTFTVKDTGGGGDWTPIDAGVYHGVCYSVVDLGTQFSQLYGVEQKKLWICWELPEERIEVEGENKPRVISNFYTQSLHEKSNLRGHLESWRGRAFTEKELAGFDISKLFGVNCQINVIHKTNQKGQTKAVIGSIMPLSKSMKKLDTESEYIYYSMEEHSLNIPDAVPDGIKAMIMKSKEYNETGQQQDEWREDNGPPPLEDSDPWGNNEPPQEPDGGIDPETIPF